jgi:lysylphosphatidylglycerol synthetase-like protein (DUF2156 family)
MSAPNAEFLGPSFSLIARRRKIPTAVLRAAAVWMVFAVTLGSGLVNLYSVMDNPLHPARARILREVFPLEFLRLSRSFTLLIGLALVISSINIYKRKRRAWKLVLALAGFSLVFHLTKGLDYEEAAFSAVLVAVLIAARRAFTVLSGGPEIGWTGPFNSGQTVCPGDWLPTCPRLLHACLARIKRTIPG